MRIVILQPSYLPWLGYFDQMSKSDAFVMYDDVQYDKNGWRNRNRIKASHGPQWLTVPVLTKGKGSQPIHQVTINDSMAWQKKHLRSVTQCYSKARFFDQYIGQLENIYWQDWKTLMDLNMACIRMLMEQLGFQTNIFHSSTLGIPKMGQTDRLIAICQHFEADTFLEGDAGRAYIDPSLFQRAGIQLEFHHYQHPVYHQLYGDFIPYMSVIDLLFNQGDDSLSILTHQKSV